MFVELHMIQNFGPSCLNRDDTNTPKDCQFGGYRRARISSQCFKRAIREYFNSQIEEFIGKNGIRSRLLPKKIADHLIEAGKDPETAHKVIKDALKKIGFKVDKKDKNRTDVLLFFKNDTPQEIADLLLTNWEDVKNGKVKKSLIKPLIEKIKTDLSPDIALFGRMVASNANLNVNAATYVSHALSTHKVDMEMDFYTAVDDLQEQEESGAGMMGMIMYNSSCFYRYLVLDLEQLISNLKGDADYAISVLKAFTKSAVDAIPTGKQTSMAAFNKPSFIMATIRQDQPWSLANAFSKPVWIKKQSSDFIEQSVTKLDQYFAEMTTLYGIPSDLKIHYCTLGDLTTPNLEEVGTHHSQIDKLINQLGEDLSERNTSSS